MYGWLSVFCKGVNLWDLPFVVGALEVPRSITSSFPLLDSFAVFSHLQIPVGNGTYCFSRILPHAPRTSAPDWVYSMVDTAVAVAAAAAPLRVYSKGSTYTVAQPVRLEWQAIPEDSPRGLVQKCLALHVQYLGRYQR